ncbi:ATP-binding protein [Streptomyces sp. SID8361]|uniref:ATP-binding protein n=1 Tax=Streptomyces TaxID=1883 RepID=UPI00081EAD0F|nr:ATP-binding protein [Streptomyces sp. MnatMP-M27]MYU09554.1 ATP-binding protein [Streptomyces sp. SID8361]SCF62966.1 Histidine kinase-like ATPase domain-containing protein [Streptomyces sp. MnatMP-M27]
MPEVAEVAEPPYAYRLSAPNSPKSPRVCRDAIAALLQANDLHDLADTAKLLVSEAVTNVNQHTDTRLIHIDTLVRDRIATIAVRDGSPERHPYPRDAAPDEEGGRGLFLMQKLAYAWGVTWENGLRPTGKHIWFELREPLTE